MHYLNKWKPYSLNREFWEEVLVGHEIVKINFGEDGISSFELDNGEVVSLVHNTLSIEIPDESIG